MVWVESSCPSDCGKVWGDVGYYHNIQRPPKQSHNRLGSYSRPRPSLIFKVGYTSAYIINVGAVRKIFQKSNERVAVERTPVTRES